MASFDFAPSFLANFLYVESVCSPQEMDILYEALAIIVVHPKLPGLMRMRIQPRGQPDKTTYYYNAPPFWIHFRESYDAEIEFLNVFLRP